MADLSTSPDTGDTTRTYPSELPAAIIVARRTLATFSSIDHGDSAAASSAHGALTESLRILLLALDASGIQPPAVPIAARCPAAHPEDPTPCGGPIVVTVLDATNAGAEGCEHHGARLLASLDGGRVYTLPDAPEGSAIRVFQAADKTRPFAWFSGPRIDPSQLSHAENRRGGGQ
ncbi:hypothetical protein AB0I66_24540 [Streptomyces sp. NPDC050439]|uniref:hypothetical protein n=1 Tax=unclassified Streptomyces TaxID=2593676 RepID=UPI003439D665